MIHFQFESVLLPYFLFSSSSFFTLHPLRSRLFTRHIAFSRYFHRFFFLSSRDNFGIGGENKGGGESGAFRTEKEKWKVTVCLLTPRQWTRAFHDCDEGIIIVVTKRRKEPSQGLDISISRRVLSPPVSPSNLSY